jgi:hypothetical protein
MPSQRTDESPIEIKHEISPKVQPITSLSDEKNEPELPPERHSFKKKESKDTMVEFSDDLESMLEVSCTFGEIDQNPNDESVTIVVTDGADPDTKFEESSDEEPLVDDMTATELEVKQPELSIDDEPIKTEENIITGSQSLEQQDPTNSTKPKYSEFDMEEETDNITDVVLMAMLQELDMELFPPRHLFLLTADLTGIELEHA